jgi:hypothetical protein
MDDLRFDQFVRSLANASRRRLLITLAGTGAAALAGARATAAECRPPDRLCREHANCCWEICGPKDASGRRRCVCPPGLIACGDTCVDPQTDPANCGGCGAVCAAPSCHAPICANGLCDSVPDPQQNGLACDDGDLCTTGDHCQNGACVSTPVDCSQFADACHTSACDPGSGNCFSQTFVDGTACDHPDECAIDPACQSGTCTPAGFVACLGDCQTCSGGGCVPLPDGTACFGGDACVNGTCVLIPCGICEELVGINCVPKPDGAPCPAGDACINGQCTIILCPPPCNDLIGIDCVPKPDGTSCGLDQICQSGNCVLLI